MVAQTSNTTSLELTITRTFNAPRELVFRAWTEPEHVLQWLGPRGFTGLSFEMDTRPGGAWVGRMRGPDGAVLTNRGVVREVVEPELLALTFAWDDENGRPGREMMITITFAEAGPNQTEMTFYQAVFESEDDRDGHIGGWNESFDKLGEYLATVQR